MRIGTDSTVGGRLHEQRFQRCRVTFMGYRPATERQVPQGTVSVKQMSKQRPA